MTLRINCGIAESLVRTGLACNLLWASNEVISIENKQPPKKQAVLFSFKNSTMVVCLSLRGSSKFNSNYTNQATDNSLHVQCGHKRLLWLLDIW